MPSLCADLIHRPPADTLRLVFWGRFPADTIGGLFEQTADHKTYFSSNSGKHEAMSSAKIDGRHVAAARELLKLTQDDLARAAGVSRLSVFNFENNKTITRPSTVAKIREALERRGIEFTNGGKPGVRLDPEKAVIPT